MNYYERHIGDYLKDTAHLSLLEHGIYTRLMDVYYTRESAIPEDQVARLIGARSKEEREALEAVLTEFFERTQDGWRQVRCEREIDRYQDKQAKAKRSANARWGAKPPHSDGNANASADGMRTHSEGNAPHARPQTPDTNHQTQLSVPDGTGSAAAKPAADLTKAELWAAGKSLLSHAGVPEKQCGSFVGKLVKDYGDEIVVGAVRAAVLTQPADPAEWLKAACMRMAGERASTPRRNGQPDPHRGFDTRNYEDNPDGQFPD